MNWNVRETLFINTKLFCFSELHPIFFWKCSMFVIPVRVQIEWWKSFHQFLLLGQLDWDRTTNFSSIRRPRDLCTIMMLRFAIMWFHCFILFSSKTQIRLQEFCVLCNIRIISIYYTYSSWLTAWLHDVLSFVFYLLHASVNDWHQDG